MKQSTNDITGTLNMSILFFISDPVISLTNKSDLFHFICMLGAHCLLQMNIGSLLFNFLVATQQKDLIYNALINDRTSSTNHGRIDLLRFVSVLYYTAFNISINYFQTKL